MLLLVNERRLRDRTPWHQWRLAYPERCRDLDTTLGGNLVAIECRDREHATELREAMIDAGFPKGAITLRKS